MFLIIICIPAPPRCAKKKVYILESYVCEFVPRKDMMSIAVPFVPSRQSSVPSWANAQDCPWDPPDFFWILIAKLPRRRREQLLSSSDPRQLRFYLTYIRELLYLALYLTCILTFYLAVCLAYILKFHLVFI